MAIQEITRRLKERFDFYIITSRFRRDLPARETRPEGTVMRLGFGTRFDKWLLPLLFLCSKSFPGQMFQAKLGTILWGVDTGQASLAAAFFKLLKPGIPFVLNLQYGESEERLSSGRLGLNKFAFKFMLRQADQVTAISSYLLELARKYGYKGSAEVIHNGVDIAKFQPRRPKGSGLRQQASENSKIIITTSRLVPKNGVDILLKAIFEVKKKIPDLQCWILGDGSERKALELQATSYKLQANVKFFGSLPHEKIPWYLQQADVFVRPSRSEGMGNSFVEALAADLPIIGTPVGGITDIIQDGKTGLFANPEDPHDLAEKMIKLLQDKSLAERIVAEGQKMVKEHFSWDKIVASYENMFQTMFQAKLGTWSVLIATPLLPPQLGGPARYAQNLAEEFSSLGHKVKVISFHSYLKFPSGIRHLFYLISLLRNGWKADVIFALDYTSVGIPAAIASLIFRKPLVVRVEGDFLWESFVEHTRRDIILKEFYKNPPPLSRKEAIIKWLSGWVMRRATKLVFSSEWRRQMLIDAYKIPSEKTLIISNVFPSVGLQATSYKLQANVILWAGRMLHLKNLYRLIRAFASINQPKYELHLVGDGPERAGLRNFIAENKYGNIFFFPSLDHQALVEKMSSAAIFVLPSLSEVGPNVIAEAIGTKTPVLMTKESGYAEYIKNFGLLIDPLDEKDLQEKLTIIMRERKTYKEKVSSFSAERPWAVAAADWLNLFAKVINSRDIQKNLILKRVLVIGRDPNLFNSESEAYLRVKEYAKFFAEYHVISVSTEKARSRQDESLYLWASYSPVLLFSWLKAIYLGRKIIKKHQIQLIDAQDPGEAGLAAFSLSQLAGVPFRLQIHTDIFSPFYHGAVWKEYLRYWLARFLIPRADCIRVVSERIRKSILGKSDFPREVQLPNISVLPIFTDIKKFLEAKPDLETEASFRSYDFKMIAVGRFVDKEKNFSMLIEMMRDFVKICPRAVLVLVGDGPDRESYKLQATSYKLQNNVIIEPWRNDLSSLYKSFDLYLSSSNYEGWGRTIIEAMASGLPIIMTDVGLAGEVIKNEHNGLVVPVGDRTAFLHAVLRLWRDPQARKKLALQARLSAIRLGGDAKHYLEKYRMALSSCLK